MERKGGETEIDKHTILRHEIIIADREDEELPRLRLPTEDRHHGNTLPFLVQQPAILRPAVMQAEFPQFAVDVEIEPGAVIGGADAVVQHACGGGGDGAVDGVVGIGFDIRGVGQVEDINVSVDAGGGGLAAAGAAVAGQDEELAVAQGVDLALGGDFGGF